jgi:glucosamine--fructose-6-phosphate aminotransferase (isomerizing)
MCGIVGCVGHENAVKFATEGLGFLEYRGYDSMGVAFPEPLDPEYETDNLPPKLKVVKSLSGVSGINKSLIATDHEATTAIGHTRWATHGQPSLHNAHPHTSESGNVAVAHNGVIENHTQLRQELQANGFNFVSQTDTEVIPHLFDYYLKSGQEPEEAFRSTVKRLVGAYAVVACISHNPDTLYTAKLGSPLILGVNGSEHFASSDPRVWTNYTKKAIRLGDGDVGILSTDGYQIKSLQGRRIVKTPEELNDDFEQAEKGDFPDWMLKEIHDQPETIRAAISGRVFPEQNIVKLGGLEDPEIQEKLKQTERIMIVACGTSYHAGLIGERLIEDIAGIPVEVQLASEFLYRNEPLSRRTAVLAISQSGETADTRAAIEKANDLGLLTLGVNNTPGSNIDQITDAGVHCRAGQEVSVASTKAFTSQITNIAEIAIALSRESNNLQHPLMRELVAIPGKIEQILQSAPDIEAAAKKYAAFKHFMYIGRGYEQISAMEGALKLKEISYIHAEAYGAGEMKHGPLALIDEEFPTFAIATDSPVYEKTLSNIEEIRSRKGPIIALATEGNEAIKDIVDDVIYVPASMEQTQPILNSVAMQLFAYYVAVEKGYNVDRPRNLAKSVTVE